MCLEGRIIIHPKSKLTLFRERNGFNNNFINILEFKLRVVVVVLLATNSSTFQQYVTGLFFDSLPKEIGNALAGAGLNTNSGVPFDQLLSKELMSPIESTSRPV